MIPPQLGMDGIALMRRNGLLSTSPATDPTRYQNASQPLTPSLLPWRIQISLQRFQELDQIPFLPLAETQLEMPVVVVHDVPQGREAAVVIVAALGMGPEPPLAVHLEVGH